ncbi:hypothetical protein AciM339_0175 [Aciduliprofundum sp. MAR08-339]|uniref:hypothetical protein n=1 Tax=Aciduliprofundum sp. (strain MAR08-339) TaxID=673860 RepID=UPI0002A496A3|nr:hypothetical protein AciM339_0175 [Aciduliprofundum sp. MAR08-339]
MIYKCEIWNSYGKDGYWTEVDVVGEDFLTEFRRRFGHLRFRNVKMLHPLTGEWIDVGVSGE